MALNNKQLFGWQLLSFFSNFRATFGCIVKQRLLDLLAQSIHAYWLFVLGEKRFTVGKSRSILLIQILYNIVKRLIFFKCDDLSKSKAFTFNTLLIFLEYLFEFLTNTAPPASDSVYQQNFTAKKL